jgi:PBP1b-binding outer membrane lipoprotein LpoB
MAGFLPRAVRLLTFLLVALLFSACGGPPATNGAMPGSVSEAQEAMVERQAFSPQFPAAPPQQPDLLSPLGNPAAAPLGAGPAPGN